jgi:tetratricopeptide (TPR) repeat protein
MVGRTLSHYRILEQIGAGGMGIVFRAHDEQLDRDVAIKVLPEGLLADETARKRFRKEALSLARLNHPNVATVHEFGSEDGTDFLVTEYIAGAAVDEKLSAGALQPREVLALGAQLAEGLAAAHEHGIVHRDLKPANLRLTPDGHLKILDFGLAQLMPQAGDAAMTVSLAQSQAQGITGTVPYMSPEQLRGEPVDARTDIWAAGAVLYEMATGKRPFPETTAPLLMSAILNRAPRAPRKLTPEMSPGLEGIILKTLEKDPGRRYQTARELGADLQRLTTGALPLAAAKRVGLRPMALTLAALLVLGIALGGYFLGRSRKPAADRLSSSIKMRRSVAVLGFKNLAGRPEEAWLSTALAEMLTTELAASGQLRTVPGEDVAQMKADLALKDAESYGKETLARIRQNVGSDMVILGGYTALGQASGGQLRLDLRLQDAASGETLASLAETAKESQVFDLISRVAAELRPQLGVGLAPSGQAGGLGASFPSNQEAMQLYSEGLEKLRVWEGTAARDLLVKAAAADPKNPLIHSALAEAWTQLGYDAKASEQAKQAFDLSTALPANQRQIIEARYYEASREREKAIAIYRALWQSFPDDLDYGLHLAEAQFAGGKGKDALVTLDALRKLPPPAGDDPRIDMDEALAAARLSDFRHEGSAAARAAQKAKDRGARVLYARARLAESRAYIALDDYSKAAASVADAERTFAEAGHMRGVAYAKFNHGGLLRDQGDYQGAVRLHEESLAIRRQIGSRAEEVQVLVILADDLKREGRLLEAEQRLKEAMIVAREIDDQQVLARVWNERGIILYTKGQLAEAKKSYEEAVAIDKKQNFGSAVVIPLSNIGETLFAQGDLAGSQKAYEEALAISLKAGTKFHAAYDLISLGEILAARGDLAAGQKNCQEGLASMKQLGNPGGIAQGHQALADLALEQGHPEESEALSRQAADEYHVQKRPDEQALAQATLAESLLAQGKVAPAREAIDHALERMGKSEDRNFRLRVNLAAARVRAAEGDPATAMTSLQATLAEARKYGFLVRQFDARLSLGQMEMKSGRTAAGRSHLGLLEKDAKARGFLLIAHKAAEAGGYKASGGAR